MASCEICMCGKTKPCVDNVATFDSLAPDIKKLLQQALASRQNAYCPYSKFKVGAAVMCNDGKIYGGCNIENVSFTVGICAERTACSKAISEGNKNFKAIAVIARLEDSFVTPCGACRQFLSEFGNVDVYCARPNLDKVLITKTDMLLPMAFVSLS